MTKIVRGDEVGSKSLEMGWWQCISLGYQGGLPERSPSSEEETATGRPQDLGRGTSKNREPGTGRMWLCLRISMAGLRGGGVKKVKGLRRTNW